MSRSELDAIAQVRAGVGTFTKAALRRLDDELDWYRELPAQERSYVGLVAQAGIAGFVAYFEDPAGRPGGVTEMFAAAPRELTQSISLHQTLQIVRTVVDTVEATADEIVGSTYGSDVREAVLRFSREVAFSAAEIYARSAEQRGAWDARLEALVIDSLIRDDADAASIASRAAALGWSGKGAAVAVVGAAGDTSSRRLDSLGQAASLRQAARRVASDALVGIHDDRVILILGGDGDLTAAASAVSTRFGPGPVVIGPPVASISAASESLAAALSGLMAAPAWPRAPRPVLADDLLPERVLAGDDAARSLLVRRAFAPVDNAGGGLVETVEAYFATGRSLEGTARELYVHPNTVRYRLRKVADITGWDPTDPREALVLSTALALGRLS